MNGRWNEAEPDSRQAPPARPGMALHRRGAVAGHAGGRQSLRPLRGAQLCRRRKPLVEGPEGCHLLSHPHADSRADEDFRRYEEAIAIPLGDREMRLALDQPDPDIEAARQGILKG
ncbi:PAS domain S-box protein, partial [Pseudomonas aeruginosa]